MNPSTTAPLPLPTRAGVRLPRVLARLAAPTTLFERVLLAVLIVILPFENTLPTIGGVSVALAGFSLVALYVLVRRTQSFFRTLSHPITLAFVALIGIGCLMEVIKEDPGFYFIRQVCRMILGALMVAALARDRAALTVAFGTLVFTGLLMSFLLFRAGGRTLYSEEAEDYFEATKIRAQAFEEMPITANLNQLGFYCALAGGLGIAMALPRGVRWKRYALGLTAAACLLGVMLTVSRGAIVVAVATVGTVLLLQRGARLQSLMLGGVIVVVLLVASPSASLGRFSFGATNVRGKQEGRAKLYAVFYEHAADYIVQGVGEIDYWEQWSVNVLGKRLGAHNAVLHLLALWGFLALVGFAVLGVAVYRSLPRPEAADPLSLCLWATAVALALRLLATHNLPSKEFSIIFGLLMAAHLWKVVRFRRPQAARSEIRRRLAPMRRRAPLPSTAS